MGAPWAPPQRPREPEPSGEPETRLAGVLARLEVAEAELARMEREAAARRRWWWVAFALGLMLAIVLI